MPKASLETSHPPSIQPLPLFRVLGLEHGGFLLHSVIFVVDYLFIALSQSDGFGLEYPGFFALLQDYFIAKWKGDPWVT